MEKPTSVDQYIKWFPADVQGILENIRRVIKEVAPQAEETISYGMPAFKFNNRVLVYYAAFKDHVSLFPTGEGVEAFKDKLKGYKASKGTIQLPLDKPIPYELISEITKHRAEITAK